MPTYALMYHGFGQEHPIPRLNVDPAVFKEQLQTLRKESFTSADPEQLSPPAPKDQRVLVTIDDGLAGSYEASLSALQQGFQPLIFLIGDKVNLPGFLTEEQISALATEGVSFGSHTNNLHDYQTSACKRLTEEVIAADLEQSITQIEQLTGKQPRIFAYPFGQVYSTLKKQVRQKFEYAFGTKPFQKASLAQVIFQPQGILTPSVEAAEDRFELPRIYLRRETTTDELVRSLQIPGYATYLKVRTIIGDQLWG